MLPHQQRGFGCVQLAFAAIIGFIAFVVIVGAFLTV